MRRWLAGGALAAVAAGAGLAWYLGPIAPIATGYAAEITCSAVFLADRDVDDAAGDLPDNPLVPLLRTRVDDSAGSVSTSLVGLWRSTAHVHAHGCTLADERPPFDPGPPSPPTDDPAPWPEGDAPVPLPDGTDGDRLEAALDAAFAEDDPDGRERNTRAVVVVHDGELIAERYGDGFDASTRLLGWSMGKSLAGAAAGRLVHEGLLDLDADGLRPEWGDDDRADITVRHLLEMTDGLAFEEVYDPDTDATRMLFRPGDVAAYAADQPLQAEPGTRWAYSSGTTNLLCAVAQDASGLGPELVEQLVFAPLGMTSGVVEPDATGTPVCSSFAYATARDWARLGQLYLDDGVWDGQRLLPEGFVADSTAPVPSADPQTPYGWQWWLNAGPDGQLRMPDVPADAFWASGNEGQQVVVVPSADLVLVRLGFSGAFSGVDWGLEPLVAETIAALDR